jgi:hypothetical protein
MENKSLSKTVILGTSLFLGLLLLGFFIFKGLKTFSDKDRVVTVKGLAEMNMMATSVFNKHRLQRKRHTSQQYWRYRPSKILRKRMAKRATSKNQN